MEYKLKDATYEHMDLLIQYKLNTIFEYAPKLDEEEKKQICFYVNSETAKWLYDYRMIEHHKKIIGAVLVRNNLDGVLLDEIFIERRYRNLGIGTKIIKQILLTYPVVYLYVYKENVKAFRLYRRLGFKVFDETETRYFMKYISFESYE